MGFWHTGYIEFHETTGIEDWCRPVPPTHRCMHCGEEFDTADDLRQHRFQAHPIKRPLLFIRGMEIGSTPVTITRSLAPQDVGTGACTSAIVNGVHMPVDHLAATLASIEQDTVRIVLEGEGANASFEIRIEIASDDDMEGVEQAFFRVAHHRRLDVRAIEQFIDGASPYKTAAAYCDGICEYLYGVLAKERSPTSSLRYEAYREKFTRALDKLRTFDRPLANRVGGLVEFHFNHFPEAASLSPGARVGRAANAFATRLSGSSLPESVGQFDGSDEQLEYLLTDWDTEQLIRWAVRDPSELLCEQAEIEKMLRSDPAEYDQTKLHILLAEIGLSSKNRVLVLTHARELRNSPSVSRWADSVIETSKGWGEH